jgi:hypothetical protein
VSHYPPTAPPSIHVHRLAEARALNARARESIHFAVAHVRETALVLADEAPLVASALQELAAAAELLVGLAERMEEKLP